MRHGIAKLIHSLIHILSLVWVMVYYYLAISDQLGGDPVQAILDFTGMGALHLLLLSLLVSPIAKALKQGQIMPWRRPLGLYAAFYACLHVASFIAFELGFEWKLIISEVIERPYITVGFVALVILIALSITSLPALRRIMGRKWQSLHNLVYLTILLICLHFWWSLKSDWLEPALYLFVALILLSARYSKFKVLRRKTKR